MTNRSDSETILENILRPENSDILVGFLILIAGGVISLFQYTIGIAIGLCVAFYFFSSFLQNLLKPTTDRPDKDGDVEAKDSIPLTISAPVTDEATIADRIKSIHSQNDFKCPSCGATVDALDMKCQHCGSILTATLDLPRPQTWSDVQIGQAIQLRHPVQGQLNLSIVHRTYYGELWQIKMRKDVPWTLTGNYYVGLGLTGGIFLLNWQSRFYVLDAQQSLSDMSINYDFTPYARKFAASNQTAKVNLEYQQTMWQITDIGRFRIEYTDSGEFHASPGALCRFMHARQIRSDRILIVEDYQSGGQDTLWIGYEIRENDIRL